jgi:transposase
MENLKVLSMEQHELIRRMVNVDGLSQREVARRLGHSRKTIAKALETASPAGYQRSQQTARPKLGPFESIVAQWLKEDRFRHRKQRHTAVRVFERLRDEHQYTGSRRAVSDLVKQLRSDIAGQDVYVPIEHQPGCEVQIDWGEADVILNGHTTRVMLFCARLAYSKSTFVRAYLRADQPSFFDGHVRLIEYLQGVPLQFAYDNLKSAVTKVVGPERSLNKKFVELRSHYFFQSRFCNVARGNEKGHTENSVKRAQRTYLTPLPSVTSMQQLNAHLLRCCTDDLQRVDKALGASYGTLFEQEREFFLKPPVIPFKACIQRPARVNFHSTVQYQNTRYSVPTRYAGMHSIVRVGVDTVEVIIDNKIVALHDRRCEGQWALNLEHYLPILERKPGLLDTGKPFVKSKFSQAEQLLRKELEYRYGEDGTRQFLSILLLCQEFDFSLVRKAIDRCVAARAFHEEAIRLELNQLQQKDNSTNAPTLDLSQRPELANVSAGQRDLKAYDALSDATHSHQEATETKPQVTSAQRNFCDNTNEIQASGETRDNGAAEPRDRPETSSPSYLFNGVLIALSGMLT